MDKQTGTPGRSWWPWRSRRKGHGGRGGRGHGGASGSSGNASGDACEKCKKPYGTSGKHELSGWKEHADYPGDYVNSQRKTETKTSKMLAHTYLLITGRESQYLLLTSQTGND
ncbi:hypothetical protein BT96DRAFT_945118 [Gymnopus androsaceus JB14]|uniref:Uncharacterized protein n=1 Tax=Gymnopus androsaceus JB14 TaxID=1447944 RepID=A0A6A4H2E1_9AGAR|nr:hypothetical protein BT96DRAFT_945118 [Gymnopus androsaceus JB14]